MQIVGIRSLEQQKTVGPKLGDIACLSAFSHRAALDSAMRLVLVYIHPDPPPTPSLRTPPRASRAKVFSPAKPALGLERSQPLLVTTRSG